MTKHRDFEIFLATAPGLEEVLLDEVKHKGFRRPAVVPGGVTFRGGWPEVWRANLWIRGASRVLARIASFPVRNLKHLEHLLRAVPWDTVLRPEVPFRVSAACEASRVYHEGAVVQRAEAAITESLGAPCAPDADVLVMIRIVENHCTISVDTSGELLHRRGYKQAVNRAPLRETLAALFLRSCGYTGSEPVVDPMCGSGTFIIEAAEIAARLNPGRARHFAFEKLATFDEAAWQAMRQVKSARVPEVRFAGSDRDAGAVRMSQAAAEKAGVGEWVTFTEKTISDFRPPEGPAGLVITNPPYGTRIGDKKKLEPLYRAFGEVLLKHFSGWRVAFLTTEPHLARATGLPLLPPGAPVAHGGLRVTLFRTAELP